MADVVPRPHRPRPRPRPRRPAPCWAALGLAAALVVGAGIWSANGGVRGAGLLALSAAWGRSPAASALAVARGQRRRPATSPAAVGLDAPGLAPPDVGGEPPAPPARRRGRSVPASAALAPQVLPIHEEAARKALKGFRVGLRRATVVIPPGSGDGVVGSLVLAEQWRACRRSPQPFRVMVLMPEPMLAQTEGEYKRLAGDGLWALRVPPGPEGTDHVAKALKSCHGLVMLCSYADAKNIVMAMRRLRLDIIDLAIFESAHAALGDDLEARKAVFEWDARYRLVLRNALYVSGQHLEAKPVQGLDRATMEVPGVPPYRIATDQGGMCGPEVYTLTPRLGRIRGLTVPIKVVPANAGKKASTSAVVAADLARVQKSLGLRCIETMPGSTNKFVTTLDKKVRQLTGDACSVVAAGNGVADALLVQGEDVDPIQVRQSIGRLSFKAKTSKEAYLLVPVAGPAAHAAWQALVEYDEEIKGALVDCAIQHGRTNGPLKFEDLPKSLKEVVVSEAGLREASSSWITEAAAAAIMAPRYEWDVWYGRVQGYMNRTKTNEVPVSAKSRGHAVGEWVARQFLEWRWGDLEADKRRRLLELGFSLQEEVDRSFSEGLAEFEQHVEEQDGDPYLPDGHFTPSGFPLGAWAVAQRAAWRKGRLSVEQGQLLYTVGFLPMPHPENAQARDTTIEIERQLREVYNQGLAARENCFRRLVLRHHPSRSRAEHAEAITRFLAGLREWFLAPREPPSTPRT